MIYFRYSEYVRRSRGYHELACSSAEISLVDVNAKILAEEIFYFKGSKTFYFKNRLIAPAAGYQYTDEEKLIIALKAVPL